MKFQEIFNVGDFLKSFFGKIAPLRIFLPNFVSVLLFGDRQQWGLVPDYDDPSWKEWERLNSEIYLATQQTGVGASVCSAGYKILKHVEINQKKILEIGPGRIAHTVYWREGMPKEYVVADRRPEMLSEARQVLEGKSCEVKGVLLPSEDMWVLPFDDASFDLVVSFYSLEHLYPLDHYVRELARVLRVGGRLVGAIPTEGGMAWGLGRYFTTRRYFKKKTTIDPDKIICWEHPNYSDHVLSVLDHYFYKIEKHFWPSVIPLIDLNLIVSFIYQKGK
ncbi:MAG: class I SAM-dependent methyltransferase [Desulfobulbaceae bacterium]|nr:class I SAM-dependent methyltransferase [Desulfobulbaceae bacterium]